MLNLNSFIFRTSLLSFWFIFSYAVNTAEAVEFNTDILDDDIKKNIDISHFSQAGYIMPGSYFLRLLINEYDVIESEFFFKERNVNGNDTIEACIKPELLPFLGLKENIIDDIKTWNNGECIDFNSIDGALVKGDLSDASLKVSIPQAWLEYSDDNWLPQSLWDDGLPGLMFDYNVNGNIIKPDNGNSNKSISSNGTLGANLGAWRLRGDYQASYRNSSGNTEKKFNWSRIYAFRALPSITSQLILGETYVNSDLFDTWRFIGSSLISDDRMIPPKLRGYAPEITGVAKTNATVIVSQKGRVLSETTVAAGPFKISDLNSYVKGQLDVKVEEADGSVQTYTTDTATVPYLTRPGQIRYKLFTGKPSDNQRHVEGPLFTSGELSWGVTNAWSLYGGLILSKPYQSVSIGLGRDLFWLGALSVDVTQSWVELDNKNFNRHTNKLNGKSWRLSYSKRFDELDSDITFAGYRFSEKNYMSMGQYIDSLKGNYLLSQGKELYTITASKNFSEQRLNTNISWSHQTYWDRDDVDYYSFALNKYINIGDIRDISLNFNLSRSKYNYKWDNAFFIGMSIPLQTATISYNASYSGNTYSQTAGYYSRLDNGDTYRINVGVHNDDGINPQISGFYAHKNDISDLSVNASIIQGNYTSMGFSSRGGITATTKGMALHPGGNSGGTRVLIDTDSVGGIPIGKGIHTNRYGYGVLTDINSYYKVSIKLDVNKLGDDVEPTGTPVKESAFTEGAIGYHHFNILKGAKVMASIKLSDGSEPPFGALVKNAKGDELGIVGDKGNTWIVGANSGDTAFVTFGKDQRCQIHFPKEVVTGDSLLLPCTIN
ncbi:fimbria/pilus outer membrane usher protein [Providencia rettgeri]